MIKDLDEIHNHFSEMSTRFSKMKQDLEEILQDLEKFLLAFTKRRRTLKKKNTDSVHVFDLTLQINNEKMNWSFGTFLKSFSPCVWGNLQTDNPGVGNR